MLLYRAIKLNLTKDLQIEAKSALRIDEVRPAVFNLHVQRANFNRGRRSRVPSKYLITKKKKKNHTKAKIRNVLFFPFSTFQCEPWGCTLFTKSSDLGCKSVTANFIDVSSCACVSLVRYFDFTNFIREKACSHRYVVPKREMKFAMNDRNSGKVVAGTAFQKSINFCPVTITGNFS